MMIPKLAGGGREGIYDATNRHYRMRNAKSAPSE